MPHTPLTSSQVLRIYFPLLPPLYRVLRMAYCDLRIRSQAINGHVPILHASAANPRRMCLHLSRAPRELKYMLSSRPISRQSPGQRLSAELVLSVKKTRSRHCPPIPLLIARLLPPSSMLMTSLTVSCGKKTTSSPFSTRNCLTCAFPSLRSSNALFRLRRARDGCSPRR